MKERLLIKANEFKIPQIEFSLYSNTNIDLEEIEKYEFYNNLKAFLDNYLMYKKVNFEPLFYGEKFEQIKKLTLSNQLFTKARILKNSEFIESTEVNKIAIELFGEDWKSLLKSNISTKEIIDIIKRNLK